MAGLQTYYYTGPGGGPGEWLTASANLSTGGLGEPDWLGPPEVLTGRVAPGLPASAGLQVSTIGGVAGQRTVRSRSAALLAFTPANIAFRAPLPGHRYAWPKRVYVHDRRSGKWFTLMLPYMHLLPRLFGDWLCTIVQRPNPSGEPSPGEQNERYVPVHQLRGSPYPNIRGAYKPDMYMPGILQLRNLATGRVVTVRTGQQDSEVLGVAADGRVAYRVNDQIWVARMRGPGVGPAVLVAQGPDVPEVHWIFCRGGGDIGACLPQPPARAKR